MIPPEDGKKMLALARSSILSHFSGAEPVDDSLKRYDEPRGIFVTLTKEGKLRGCIGFPEPVLPLYEAIIESAESAAFGDPRFPSVKEKELDEIRIEVSVLTVPKELTCPKEEIPKNIQIGTHGLIIRGFSSGLLLPQVATEWKFTPATFLEAICQKAGLQRDAWKREENKLFTFKAQIFTEDA